MAENRDGPIQEPAILIAKANISGHLRKRQSAIWQVYWGAWVKAKALRPALPI